MENMWSFIIIFGQVAAVVISVFVVTSIAMILIRGYQRRRRLAAAASRSSRGASVR